MPTKKFPCKLPDALRVEPGFLHAKSASVWSMLTELWDGSVRVGTHPSSEERTFSWGVFIVLFFGLLMLDNTVLNRMLTRRSVFSAFCYAAFWILCAVCFCTYIHVTRGTEAAVNWGTGYLFEWMLSLDHLFVFQRIFSVFGTPMSQRHKPLFVGIVGAVCLRMPAFCAEQALIHSSAWIHYLFGAFLVYAGVRALMSADDEGENGWVFETIISKFSYIDMYHSSGAFFFMRVPVSKKTGEVIFGNLKAPSLTVGDLYSCISKSPVLAREVSPAKWLHVPPVPFTEMGKKNPEEETVYEWRGTRLLLVVVLLEVTEFIFAVDSMTIIVAQVPDFFISFTACAFAMLGLRATFFVLDELARFFTFMDYGVSATLILMGVKLLTKRLIHVSHLFVYLVVVSIFVLSIGASFAYEMCKTCQQKPTDLQRAPADWNKALRCHSLPVGIEGSLISARKPMSSRSLVPAGPEKTCLALSLLTH
mmetsp:Transcript_126491/g.219307  ORF Transcript_126491/g.219307 Transcript_126491/m.219307 type:complete len:477 (+) Transcript_126491:131-1561(+)